MPPFFSIHLVIAFKLLSSLSSSLSSLPHILESKRSNTALVVVKQPRVQERVVCLRLLEVQEWKWVSYSMIKWMKRKASSCLIAQSKTRKKREIEKTMKQGSRKKTGETHIRSALKREKKPDRYVVCREQTCKTRENNGMDLLSYIFFPLSSTYDRQVKKHNKEEGMMTALYSSRGGYFFLIPCKIQEKEAASALSFIPSSSSPCSWRCIHLLVP